VARSNAPSLSVDLPLVGTYKDHHPRWPLLARSGLFAQPVFCNGPYNLPSFPAFYQLAQILPLFYLLPISMSTSYCHSLHPLDGGSRSLWNVHFHIATHCHDQKTMTWNICLAVKNHVGTYKDHHPRWPLSARSGLFAQPVFCNGPYNLPSFPAFYQRAQILLLLYLLPISMSTSHCHSLHPEDGGSRALWNVGTLPHCYTLSWPEDYDM
jgi:hypothetical protein